MADDLTERISRAGERTFDEALRAMRKRVDRMSEEDARAALALLIVERTRVLAYVFASARVALASGRLVALVRAAIEEGDGILSSLLPPAPTRPGIGTPN